MVGKRQISCCCRPQSELPRCLLCKGSRCGGIYNLLAHTLPNFGITASFVNIHDLAEVEAAIKDNTRAIYIETLGNP
ncbi:MAG: PLP-dependent transferase, partial [Lachnospiraceae bacterium]|nr:PLP-dependent transferase [Lachnospiraceae bacterium]